MITSVFKFIRFVGLILVYISLFDGCSKFDWEKKGRTNPLDSAFSKLVFRIQPDNERRYAELNEKLIFKWEKLFEEEALNPELWVYIDNRPIEKMELINFNQKSGEFEVDLKTRSFKHLQNLQIFIKQSQNGVSFIDSLNNPIVLYDEKQSPLITTPIALQIGTNFLELQSEIIKLSDNLPDEIIVCLNTTGSPTPTDMVFSFKGNYTEGQKLISSFDSLKASTNYSVRVCIKKGSTTNFGKEKIFTTKDPTKPILSGVSVSSITSNSCSLNASILDFGGADIIEKGFLYSTKGAPSINDTKVLTTGTNSDIKKDLNGLKASTQYFVSAFATNSKETSITPAINFSTAAESLRYGNNCNSLDGVIAKFEYWSGTNYSWADWTINSNGYLGSCYYADNGNKSALGGYVQFTQNFASEGFIRFWINTFNAGSNNRIPTIIVDGVAQGPATLIAGQASSFYWARYQSPLISSGFHTIRLDWSRTGQHYYYKVDEIEVYY